MENSQAAGGEEWLGFYAVSSACAEMLQPVQCGEGEGNGRLE